MKIEITISHGLIYQSWLHEIKDIGRNNVLRMLKGLYTNESRFAEQYLSNYKHIELLKPLCNYFLANYEKIVPFTYKEAFEIKDENFQRFVFSAINISELIENLGATRIKVEGKEVTRKCFDKEGNTLPSRTYYAIYETYKIDGSKLLPQIRGRNKFIYAVKCWCTSTNKEHWLWIEDSYKDEPLEAIASTFRFHENVIPHIKELKRQGDIMLVELNKDIIPKGKIIPLTAEQYFNFLTIET